MLRHCRSLPSEKKLGVHNLLTEFERNDKTPKSLIARYEESFGMLLTLDTISTRLSDVSHNS